MQKNILISGGSGGIGSEIARKFISKGFKVFSIDLEEKDLGTDFVNFKADVTNLNDLYKLERELKDVEFAHIFTLAGRALGDEWKKFEEISDKTIEESILLNLAGQINVVKIFFKHLNGNKKSITLMSSINAYGGFGLPIYSAAKMGLVGFMNSMKDEFEESGIRINVIAPGTVVTEATKKEPKDFDALLKYTDHNHFVTTKDVANLSFEIAEQSDITGKVYIIDEGQLRNKNGN